MTIKEASEILEKHNKWRRCNGEQTKADPVSPKDLGVAIDVIVRYFK